MFETFIFKNTFLLFGLNIHLIAVLKITSENKGSYEKKMRIIFLLSLLVIRHFFITQYREILSNKHNKYKDVDDNTGSRRGATKGEDAQFLTKQSIEK